MQTTGSRPRGSPGPREIVPQPGGPNLAIARKSVRYRTARRNSRTHGGLPLVRKEQPMRLTVYGLALAAGLLLPGAATAGPASQPAGLARAAETPMTTQVHWRRYWHCHGPRWNRRCHGQRRHWRSRSRAWQAPHWRYDKPRWHRRHDRRGRR